MKSKKLNLGKWMFILSGILLFALSSCTKDELETESATDFKTNDAIPEFQEDIEKHYQ